MASAALAAAGLAINVVASIERVGTPLWERLPRRFWQDVHMAEALYEFGEFPVRANGVVRWRDETGATRYREEHPHFATMAEREGIRAWQFWRTVRVGRFLRPEWRQLADRYDDSGRPLITALGYHVVQGIAPMMSFWVAPLLGMGVLAWSAWELARAGRAVAAAVFALLVGASPFVADALCLAHSSAGFHVLAVLAAAPLLVFAVLGPAPGAGALLARAALTGVILAACMLARGGAALTLAAVVIASVVGGRRAAGSAGWRKGLALAAAALLLSVLPYAAARIAVSRLVQRTASAYGRSALAPQRHALWFGMWTGLGDFDREKGFRWLDAAASAAGVAAGGTPLRPDGYDPGNEAIFRRLVLDGIRSDPSWYAAILLRRVAATVTQRKLWPWEPLNGRSLAPIVHENEGMIDSYYALTTPADRLGWGGRSAEVPIPLLAAPALLLAAAATRRGPRGPAQVMAALAAGVLPLPVLITTGGAVETQTFVLVYFAGWALAVDALFDGMLRQGAHGSPSTHTRWISSVSVPSGLNEMNIRRARVAQAAGSSPPWTFEMSR